MGGRYLTGIGTYIDIPAGSSYVDLGWTSNLENRIRKLENSLGIQYSSAGSAYVGVTATYRNRAGGNQIYTAYQTLPKEPFWYRPGLKAHEETHVADRLGQLHKVEKRHNLRLRGKKAEDKANLVELKILDDKYGLENILASNKNPQGLLITDSSGPERKRYQLRYHKKIVKEYYRQKNQMLRKAA